MIMKKCNLGRIDKSALGRQNTLTGWILIGLKKVYIPRFMSFRTGKMRNKCFHPDQNMRAKQLGQQTNRSFALINITQRFTLRKVYSNSQVPLQSKCVFEK